MKLLGICGSHRKAGSNSEWMVKTVLESAKKHGARVELIRISDHDIKFCTACDTCYAPDADNDCVIKDDMRKIYKKLLEADGLVFGTPNYFRNVSAMMKNFMDRTNALVMPKKKLKGKCVIGLCVGGQPLSDTAHCEKAFENFFWGHGLRVVAMIKAQAEEPNELKKNKKIEEELVKSGEKLVLALK